MEAAVIAIAAFFPPASSYVGVEQELPQVRESKLPDRIKGQILLSFVKEGMNGDRAMEILGRDNRSTTFGFGVHGESHVFQKYGVGFTTILGKVVSKESLQ